MIEFSPDPYVAENQLKALVFCLVAFGYIDNDFDPGEKEFIRQHIRTLIQHRADQVLADEAVKAKEVETWIKHFDGVLDQIDISVQRHFTESVGEGETTQQFVLAKLKLGCFEMLKRFDAGKQQEILGALDQLMRADGVIHPAEQAFRDEIVQLIDTPTDLEPLPAHPAAEGGHVIIDEESQHVPSSTVNHPLLAGAEWDYATDRAIFAEQCKGDMALVDEVMATLERQRTAGKGRLAGAKDFTAFAGTEPFMDGHVCVLPPQPNQEVELLVLGDLHGCYSCLKAALMQQDFFAKVQAHEEDPQHHPAPYLVLLGDYIDRGKFSYSGTLRAVMKLYAKMPDRVFMLRGNHEYYLTIKGRVVAPVRPCEAMDSIADVAENSVFARYKELFEALPTMLVFDRTLFVHGGIPRADTVKDKLTSLESLNNWELRFQMMWSDPSDAEVVPLDLQKDIARFSFGRLQFQHFMNHVGCRTMVRGHERVNEGFRKVYDDPDGVLLTLFSAGGATNEDLPESSVYREVTPMALSVRYRDGVSTVTPFAIDYARFNDPAHNAFFKSEIG